MFCVAGNVKGWQSQMAAMEQVSWKPPSKEGRGAEGGGLWCFKQSLQTLISSHMPIEDIDGLYYKWGLNAKPIKIILVEEKEAQFSW